VKFDDQSDLSKAARERDLQRARELAGAHRARLRAASRNRIPRNPLHVRNLMR
jgi:hypothetical protein